MKDIHKSIFRGYDVRGTYPTEINEELAYKVGRALVKFLKCKKVVIGYDMRKSSKKLLKAAIKGVTDQGADITEIGLCTTPLLNFSVVKYKYDAGIMITASHNPKEYNGLKLIAKKAVQLDEKSGALIEIKKLVEKNKFRNPKKKGKIRQKKVINNYVNHVLKYCKNIKNLKIVADYGNGTGSITAKKVFSKLKIKTINMYDKPDGRFPNHPPNPDCEKNFEELKRKVKKEKADLGIFFDGDADRIRLVDERGRIAPIDFFLCAHVIYELKKHPHQKIYYDLRFSKALKEEILKHKGIPVMMGVGNPLYKRKLITEGGLIGGELSGHIMFKENYFLDDGLFAVIKTMNIICKMNKKLSEIIKLYKKYYQTKNIRLKVTHPDYIIQKIKETYKRGKLNTTDGILIEFSDWWFNLRKSKTEPLIELRIEANTKEKLKEKRKEILKLLQRIKHKTLKYL